MRVGPRRVGLIGKSAGLEPEPAQVFARLPIPALGTGAGLFGDQVSDLDRGYYCGPLEGPGAGGRVAARTWVNRVLSRDQGSTWVGANISPAKSSRAKLAARWITSSTAIRYRRRWTRWRISARAWIVRFIERGQTAPVLN